MWAGMGVSLYAIGAAGVLAQMFVLALGLVGTAVILFVVRTTARQSLILS
jgi:hypothetical protein